MEIQLILGANSSGKSLYAEETAVAAGSKRIYLATMVAQNEENRQRIEKHRHQRKDKGFVTVEESWDLSRVCSDCETVVLLEDVSNLWANGMFMHGVSKEQTLEQILDLAKRCKELVIVSISGLVSEEYDGETTAYIQGLNWLNEKLKQAAGRTVEMQNGVPQELA